VKVAILLTVLQILRKITGGNKTWSNHNWLVAMGPFGRKREVEKGVDDE
jgi:hypothetical protein